MTRYVFFKDYTGADIGIETPLTSNIDVNEIKHELNIPSFVNTESYVMERALLTIYAAINAHRMHESYPDIVPKNLGTKPIPALLFGGIAIRMHSPSSNIPGNPFFRQPNDIDLIVPKKMGSDLVKLLLKLGEIYGTRYHYFVTASDKTFNAIRGGERYRVRTIGKITEEGVPIPGVLDILADCVDLRHKIEVRNDFNSPVQQTYTISLANILLTKCQFIFDAPGSMMPQISEAGLGYRVLNYPHLKSDRLVIGMEEKDIMDVCAILADNAVEDKQEAITPATIGDVLRHDKKFALTVRLNLQNILENSKIFERLKIGSGTLSKITDEIQEILKVVPVVDNKWDKPWWNVDVETPEIFGKEKSH